MNTALNSIHQDRFAVPLSCPNCKQAGSATWVESRGANAQPLLVSVSNGFHRSEGTSFAGSPNIICDRCDSQLPD